MTLACNGISYNIDLKTPALECIFRGTWSWSIFIGTYSAQHYVHVLYMVVLKGTSRAPLALSPLAMELGLPDPLPKPLSPSGLWPQLLFTSDELLQVYLQLQMGE